MNPSWQPFNADSSRTVQVIRHPTATFVDLLNGTASDGVDLSQYVGQCKHTSKDIDVTFNYHNELNGTAQPQPGELIELRLNGQFLFVGIVDSISSYRFKTGEHSLQLKAYTRDNMHAWKDVQLVTELYPAGTPIGTIASDVAQSMGLTLREINLPPFGSYTPHSNMQLANISGQAMLETCMQAAGYQPFVDATGVLRAISRDLGRVSDITLTEDRVISVDGSKARSPVTSVRVKWLDPKLTLSTRQSQSLFSTTLTAGFFQLSVKQDVYFSSDRTQRAQNTYLKITHSANSGLIPACSENYTQVSEIQGTIELDSLYWAPGLATTALAGLALTALDPDAVAVFGFGASGGTTIPQGRVTQCAAEIAIMLVMMSLGTGSYEVWGEPYDYVHARNTTEAMAANVPDWLLQIDEIESDFVMSETAAQSFAARELIYRARSATTYRVSMVDDPRIEPGDILQLYDGTRLYVTDYTRTLSFGSSATLEVQGFQA